MKKNLILILTIIMTFSLVACSNSIKKQNAQEVTTEALTYIKNLDYDNLSKIFGYDEVADLKADLNDDLLTPQLVSTILQNMNFEIINSVEDEDTACVTVTISSVDMQTFTRKYMAVVLETAATGKLNDLDESDIDTFLQNLLLETFNNNSQNIISTDIDIILDNEDETWEIDNTDIIFDTIFGGLINLDEQIEFDID